MGVSGVLTPAPSMGRGFRLGEVSKKVKTARPAQCPAHNAGGHAETSRSLFQLWNSGSEFCTEKRQKHKQSTQKVPPKETSHGPFGKAGCAPLALVQSLVCPEPHSKLATYWVAQ